MSNKNYQKGAQREYRIVRKLREAGYHIVQRTAGSHSPFDVIAIDRTFKEIKLIQSKPKSLSENKKKELEKEHDWLNGIFKVDFYVI